MTLMLAKMLAFQWKRFYMMKFFQDLLFDQPLCIRIDIDHRNRTPDLKH